MAGVNRRRALSADSAAVGRRSFEQYKFMCQRLQDERERICRRNRRLTTSFQDSLTAASGSRCELLDMSLGSFDVEKHCSNGGVARIGVNGVVRQPDTEKLDDPYNELLLNLNSRTSTLDFPQKKPFIGLERVPLCWEDELSVQGAKVVKSIKPCPTNQTRKLSRERTASRSSQSTAYKWDGGRKPGKPLKVDVTAQLAWKDSQLKITIISQSGNEMEPPLDKWQFDVLITDLSDERKSSRAYKRISPLFVDGEFVMRFNLAEDLPWIRSRLWFAGRHVDVDVSGVRPWRFHLLKETIELKRFGWTEEDDASEEQQANKTTDIKTSEEDEDLIPASSMPALLLETLGLETTHESTTNENITLQEGMPGAIDVDSIVKTILRRQKSKEGKEKLDKDQAKLTVVSPTWESKKEKRPQSARGMRGRKLSHTKAREKSLSPVQSRQTVASTSFVQVLPFRKDDIPHFHRSDSAPPQCRSLVIDPIFRVRRQTAASVPSRHSMRDTIRIKTLAVTGQSIGKVSRPKSAI
eukprot:m.23898 g.23898  ORF g.23898 m.23898 type:complete len:524 (+) comp28547_c0_seq4:38-1609(+)